MPTVSIIIPVYKAEHYLDACMRSVVGQSCTDLEILLVDDGSPDRCPEMCDAWAARDPRVRVLHRKNGGAASARNAGLDAATGDFIFFADADDLLEPDAIEYLVKAEQQYGTDLVIGNMLYVDAENHPMAEPDFTGFTDTVRTVDEVWEHYFALDNRKVYYVVVWNKLYKRAMFDTLRFRDGKRYEDQFFMLDVLRRCQTTSAAAESTEGVIEFDNLRLDMNSYELRVKGKVVEAPPKELELLYHLAASPNRVFTRNQLLDEVWGFDYFGDSRTVDVHIKRLREKIENVSDQWELKTVWGVGYKFEVK